MIKLCVFDFDGVFTDGKILFDNDGNVLKHYNCKDGNGIFRLHKMNVQIGVISGYKENNSQLEIIKHLKINRISLGSDEKLKKLKEWCLELNIDYSNVAYMGDDINDLEVMLQVGLTGCPKNSSIEIKNISNFLSQKNGGDGAVREFCDYIIKIINRTNEKISCVIPCAKINSINQNSRKFCDSSLLDIKLENLKNLHFDELILSSNDDDLKKYKNENIIFDKRNEYLCTNNNSYKDLYTYHSSTIKNEVMFYTTPLTPFLNNSSIDKLISFWKNNPNYELVIFSQKIRNIIKKDNKYLPLHHAGFIVDIKTFEKYNYDISEIKNIYYIELLDLETLVISNNTNFVLAESLFYRNFTNTKLIDDYMLNHNFKKTKVLDCTIRDSGYLNNWNWDYDVVKNFVYYMGEIGVEYCEIGFLKDEKYVEKDAGIWRNLANNLNIIKKLKQGTKCKIAVMIDIGSSKESYYDVNLLPNQKDSEIDLIRVFAFFKVIDRSINVCNILKDKGYIVSLNIGHCVHLEDYEIKYVKNLVISKKINIDYLYFADSLGMMTSEDSKKFISTLKDIFPVKNGFHNHNNNGTVFANIVELINSNIDIVDGSISGFGKNGGNANLEQILMFLFFKKNYDLNIEKLLEFLNLIKNLNFYNENNIQVIDIMQIKRMLHQFMNVHSSYFNKVKDKSLIEIYNNLKDLKYIKKVWE
jgi:3-deoxy-D-manno-octulosonate 8-phosphate phosphatase (KDO 8-P phosphatase)